MSVGDGSDGMKWLRNASASTTEAESHPVHTAGDSSSPPSSPKRRKRRSKRKKKKKVKKKKKKDEDEDEQRERRKRKLSDRDKITKAEAALVAAERYKQRKRLRLQGFADDVCSGLDVRTREAVWAEEVPGRDSFIDRKGNLDNPHYAYMSPLDVPRYALPASDFIIGCESSPQWFVRALLAEKTTADPGHESRFKNSARYFSARNRLRCDGGSAQPCVSRSDDSKSFEQWGDFMPLVDRKGGPEGVHVDGLTGGTIHQRREMEFREQLRETPNNISLWIEFIGFLGGPDSSDGSMCGVSTWEKQKCEFERSILLNPTAEKLIIAYLAHCRMRDAPSELRGRWEKAVSKASAGPLLWKAYTTHIESEMDNFSVEKAIDAHARALAAVTQKCRDDARPVVEAEATVAAFLFRAVDFLTRSGHSERAIGILQANAEYNLFCPNALRGAKGRQIKFKRELFRAFWDSEAPRMGDTGAQGWAAWHEKQEVRDLQNQRRPHGEGFKAEKINRKDRFGGGRGSSEKWTSWAGVERGAEKSFSAPLRGLRAEKLNDFSIGAAELDRVVFYEDVGPFLCDVTTTPSQESLIIRLVRAAGARGNVADMCRRPGLAVSSWTADACRAATVEEIPGLVRVPGFGESGDWTGANDPGSYYSASLTLSSNPQRFHSSAPVDSSAPVAPPAPELKRNDNNNSAGRVSSGQSEFCDDVFRAALSGSAGPALARSSALTVARIASKVQGRGFESALHEFKTVLESQPNRLRLWAGYAELLTASGHIKKAAKVCRKALALCDRLPSSARAETPALFWTYANILIFRLRDEPLAQRVLAAAPSGSLPPKKSRKPLSPIEVARVRKRYADALVGSDDGDESTGSGDAPTPYRPVSPDAYLAMCRTWFEYFRDGIQTALQTLEQCPVMRERIPGFAGIPGLNVRAAQREWLEVERVRLIQWHSATNPAPVRILRDALRRALAMYPDNGNLLSVLTRVEGAGTQSTLQFRRFFSGFTRDHSTPSHPATIAWTHWVARELTKPASQYQIIRIFERALAGPSRACAALWRMYVRWLTTHGHAAKEVFLRSLRSCPGCKCLWVEGIRLLSKTKPPQIDKEEMALLKRAGEALGIRIRAEEQW